MAFVDYYKILGVDKNIPQKDVRAAYRKRAKQFHPDLHPNDPKAKAKFQALNEAYEVISDPDKRAKYDQYGEQWKNVGGFGGGGYDGAAGGGAAGGNPFEGFDFSSFGGGGGGFSSFFENLFGGGRARGSQGAGFGGFGGFGGAGAGFGAGAEPIPRQDHLSGLPWHPTQEGSQLCEDWRKEHHRAGRYVDYQSQRMVPEAGADRA